MVSITDKLAAANKELKSGAGSVKDVSKILAEAGKMSATLDMEVMETIEVTEEFEFMNTTLEEFVEFDASGMLETEEGAMNCVADHESLANVAEKYQKAYEAKIKKAQKALNLPE